MTTDYVVIDPLILLYFREKRSQISPRTNTNSHSRLGCDSMNARIIFLISTHLAPE